MDLKLDKTDARVARQIIVGPYCQTLGYELLFQDNQEAHSGEMTRALPARPLSRTQLSLELEKLVGANTALINFPQYSLLSEAPVYFDPERIVVGVMSNAMPGGRLLEACRELKRRGYRLALADFDPNHHWQSLSHLIDIIRIDVRMIAQPILARRVATLKRNNKALLAEHVENADLFHECKRLGFDYFQGYYFSRPEFIDQQVGSAGQFAMQQLLADPH